MHAISSYRGNRHRPPARPPATNTQTHRQDRLQYTAPSAQCKNCRCALQKRPVTKKCHHAKEALCIQLKTGVQRIFARRLYSEVRLNVTTQWRWRVYLFTLQSW